MQRQQPKALSDKDGIELTINTQMLADMAPKLGLRADDTLATLRKVNVYCVLAN